MVLLLKNIIFSSQLCSEKKMLIFYDSDRSLVHVDLRTLIPTYVLEMEKGPRTVLATNKMNKMKFFVVFSVPLANSTNDVLNALDVNSGYFVPISTVGHTNRKFVFEVSSQPSFFSWTRIYLTVIFLYLLAKSISKYRWQNFLWES